MKKSLLNIINEINEMMPSIQGSDERVVYYDGSTFPSYIDLNALIEVKNQFVYIHQDEHTHNYPFDKRYNTNNEWQTEQLIYDLRLIRKEYKKHLKNN